MSFPHAWRLTGDSLELSLWALSSWLPQTLSFISSVQGVAQLSLSLLLEPERGNSLQRVIWATIRFTSFLAILKITIFCCLISSVLKIGISFISNHFRKEHKSGTCYPILAGSRYLAMLFNSFWESITTDCLSSLISDSPQILLPKPRLF